MRSNKAKISVVVPVFNEEGNIAILAEKLVTALSTYADYEIIFVDDGSTDKTLSKIKKARLANKKISFISFSRNFGHQNALRAGLDYATGSCVISIDGDLQHPVELIPKMVAKWKEGFDIVYTIRKEDSSLPF
jgi:dolichol-phosphate mannosyltransferase